jgi:predicted nucleotidyltransferase
VTDWEEFQPAHALGTLVAHGVDFVVIGGLAAVLHGSTRITQDVDVCYDPQPANLEILGHALTELDARLFGVDEDVPFVPDADTLRRTEVLTLATAAGKLDLLRAPAGAPPYTELRRRAETVSVGAFGVRIASPPDLIAMKAAAGRAKDLADIEELEAIASAQLR